MAYPSVEDYLRDVTLKLSGYLLWREYHLDEPDRDVCKAAVRVFVEGDGYLVDDERLEQLCIDASAVPREIAEVWAEEDGYFERMVEAFLQAEISK